MINKETVVRTEAMVQKSEKRTENTWDEITEAERRIIRTILTDRLIEISGYLKTDRDSH